MTTRPNHIYSPSELDIADRNFPAKSMAWTDQMRSEMDETLALTKQTITESRILMAEIDRQLARS